MTTYQKNGQTDKRMKRRTDKRRTDKKTDRQKDRQKKGQTDKRNETDLFNEMNEWLKGFRFTEDFSNQARTSEDSGHRRRIGFDHFGFCHPDSAKTDDVI